MMIGEVKKNMKKMTTLTAAVFALAISVSAQTSGGQDMKNAGSETKAAAKDVGSSVVKGTKKTGRAIKHGTKKGVNKVAGATEDGASKVKSKTDQ